MGCASSVEAPPPPTPPQSPAPHASPNPLAVTPTPPPALASSGLGSALLSAAPSIDGPPLLVTLAPSTPRQSPRQQSLARTAPRVPSDFAAGRALSESTPHTVDDQPFTASVGPDPGTVPLLSISLEGDGRRPGVDTGSMGAPLSATHLSPSLLPLARPRERLPSHDVTRDLAELAADDPPRALSCNPDLSRRPVPPKPRVTSTAAPARATHRRGLLSDALVRSGSDITRTGSLSSGGSASTPQPMPPLQMGLQGHGSFLSTDSHTRSGSAASGGPLGSFRSLGSGSAASSSSLASLRGAVLPRFAAPRPGLGALSAPVVAKRHMSSARGESWAFDAPAASNEAQAALSAALRKRREAEEHSPEPRKDSRKDSRKGSGKAREGKAKDGKDGKKKKAGKQRDDESAALADSAAFGRLETSVHLTTSQRMLRDDDTHSTLSQSPSPAPLGHPHSPPQQCPPPNQPCYGLHRNSQSSGPRRSPTVRFVEDGTPVESVALSIEGDGHSAPVVVPQW